MHGLSNIHKLNIIHNNLSDDSIVVLVSDKSKDFDFSIKFIDFGVGCGLYKIPINNFYNTKNKNGYYLQKCHTDKLPIKVIKKTMNNKSNHQYVKNLQRHDSYTLGLILLNLILPELNIDINNQQYYNSSYISSNVLVKISEILSSYEELNSDDEEFLDHMYKYINIIINIYFV